MIHSIAVIGAGWYGCHIAATLLSLGFSVEIFERSERIFHEASGNNQFRLHQGFHYARHHGTRVQSRDGYMRFIERYPALSKEVACNIYAVPTIDSLIDLPTYKLIMTSTGIAYKEVREAPINLQGVSGMLLTDERVLCLERSRVYFHRRLGSALHLGTRVNRLEEDANGVWVNGRRFDVVVDATWGHFLRPPADVFYEPTLLLYYEGPVDHPAVTLVDGPLCSVYPTDDPSIYTLSSVTHTPLGIFSSAVDAHAFRDNAVTATLIEQKRQQMETHISRYMPDFRDKFRFVGPQTAIKTKLFGNHDDRSCYVFHQGRKIIVMSGKVDTIFVATERILAALEAEYGGDLLDVSSTLKRELPR
ncbi:FAD-dependent oxidoreductase [alpha proteobacterium AAP38]|nr:FAD-dependent oxidoreductase [alpha proteobacterium AAP38]